MLFQDKDGKFISNEEAEKKLKDINYKRVAETKLETVWVSTVWLGIDMNLGFEKPQLFETMVFEAKDGAVTNWGDLEMDRYATVEEAKAGHAAIVEKWRRNVPR